MITSDEAVRGGKTIPIKATVDKALAHCPTVKTVLVAKRTGADVPMGPHEHYLQDAMARESAECPPVIRSSEDYLFLLYTSGSTGKPKGLAHSTGGYLTYAGLTHKVFLKPPLIL